MQRTQRVLMILILVIGTMALCLPAELAEARGGGRGGGGGGRGGGGGGFSRGGGGGGGGGARMSAGSMNRPSPGASRSMNRPSGGSMNRSSFDHSRGSAPRPSTRPSAPSGIQRPPAGMAQRPSQLPSRQQGGGASNRMAAGQRPQGGYTQRPATRPAAPTAPNRGGGRPSQADLEGFLQGRPAAGGGTPSQLPATRPGTGVANRPAAPGQAPGISQLPAGPGQGARPGAGPGISTLPALGAAGVGAGISQLPATRPGDRFAGGAENRAANLRERPEQLPAEWNDRWNDWHDQADDIRNEWHDEVHDHYDDYHDWYDDHYWHGHYHPYYPYYSHCHDCDWWSCPATWMAVGSFVGAVASQPAPVYYTYGSGGTVYVEGDTIVLNGTEQVPAEEYTEQLVEQVSSIPETASDELEWMPLGVFTLVDKDAPEVGHMLQLTVSQTGVLAGMFHNKTTDTAVPIEGTVDAESSRAVWTPVGKTYPIVETGLYNLIQDQTQVLIHFEDGTVEERLLVRLDKPEDPQTASAGQESSPQPQQ